jgi:apolipoprotein N-acyltransferase
MHIVMNGHYFFLVLALVLGILATLSVPSSRINLLAGSFTAYLIALFFS